MFREMLKSKIHHATITEANLEYVGSITIDQDLMDAVDILPYEKVAVVDKNNGARFETYVIAGERGSGVMCVNGAAARLVQPGDTIIIFAYTWLEEARVRAHQPQIVVLGPKNEIAQRIEKEEHEMVM
jgi:aspartate 1-decarboxylase